jgi:peptidyl-prolyl cis-trans isomerase D
MFDFIRNHKRWMQFVLLLLIVPSFMFFGVEGYSSFMSSEPDIAEVDGKPITLGEFNNARRDQLEQYRQMLGSQFDPAAIDTPVFRQDLLNTLIDQRVLGAAAARGRYSVSDDALRNTIAAIPAVQVNGQFSPERYRQVLASQGLTPNDFELGLRRDLVLRQVLGPIGVTASAPLDVTTKLLNIVSQTRTIAIREFKAEQFANTINITDEQIKSWYDQNAQTLKVPEYLTIDYVVLDEDAASKDIKVSAAEIEHYYEQNQTRYSQPERRRVSHILIEVTPDADTVKRQAALAQANDLLVQAKADPSKFAQLARDFSQDPGSAQQGGDLGWISRSTLIPQVEDAVFKLNKGDIGGVIESPFGDHVIYVTDIQAPTVKPLDQVRGDIENEVRRQMASKRFADLATKLSSAVYDQRDSLAPIAKSLGLTLRQATGLSKEGVLRADLLPPGTTVVDIKQRELLDQMKVRQAAFSNEVLKDRLTSGVIEISSDTMLAIHVTAVQPPAVPPLAQVAEKIRIIIKQEAAVKLARTQGESVLAALQSAKNTAEGFGAVQTVSRQNPLDLSANELATVMTANINTPPVFVGVNSANGFRIIEITGVSAGVQADAAQINQFRQQLSQAWGNAQERAALSILRTQYGVKIKPEAEVVIKNN